MSIPGVRVDRGGETSVQPACRRVGVHLSGHPGEESGERDRTGDTRPRWEGLLWTAPPETQIAQSRGCRGYAALPATRSALGAHVFRA